MDCYTWNIVYNFTRLFTYYTFDTVGLIYPVLMFSYVDTRTDNIRRNESIFTAGCWLKAGAEANCCASDDSKVIYANSTRMMMAQAIELPHIHRLQGLESTGYQLVHHSKTCKSIYSIFLS